MRLDYKINCLFLIFFFTLNVTTEYSFAVGTQQLVNDSFVIKNKGIMRYRCPPCGCPSDSLVFNKNGRCGTCSMPLVKNTNGYAKNIDEAITPIFRGVKLYNLYSKFFYPIILISILLSLFLIFLMIRNKSSNVFLPLIILVLSLFAFQNQLYDTHNGHSSHWRSLFTPISFVLSTGPLIFFYVKSQLSIPFKWINWYWLHFLPTLLMFSFYSVVIFSSQAFQQQFMSSPHGTTFSHYEQLITVTGSGIYLISAGLMFKKWKKMFASYNIWLAKWLNRFLLGITALLFSWGIMLVIDFWLYDFGLITINYNPLWYVISGILIWLVIEILLNPKFFLLRGRTTNYRSEVISKKQLAKYQSDLTSLMEDQRVYTDSELSLNKLARMMNINPRYLSVILNDVLNKSFYDYINYYRIEQVKYLLKGPDHEKFTIEAIANKSGFKSKSSFNLAFKKYTKMTPREFISNSKN